MLLITETHMAYFMHILLQCHKLPTPCPDFGQDCTFVQHLKHTIMFPSDHALCYSQINLVQAVPVTAAQQALRAMKETTRVLCSAREADQHASQQACATLPTLWLP